MKAGGRSRWPRLGTWATLGLIGAFLAGALLEGVEDGPRVGRVRLDELAAEFVTRSVREAASMDAAAAGARDWAGHLQDALDAVAQRHGVVLLPSQMVAAGATDYTAEVRSAMEVLRRASIANAWIDESATAAPDNLVAPGNRAAPHRLGEPGERR